MTDNNAKIRSFAPIGDQLREMHPPQGYPLNSLTDYVTFLFEKRFLRKGCKEHSIVCISALMIINKIV